MPELLKNIYNAAFFEEFTALFQQVKSDFDQKLFIKEIHTSNWEVMELKQRMRHIAFTLNRFLTGNYQKDIETLCQLINLLIQQQNRKGLEYLFLPDYIEQFGINEFDTSIKAMEKFTQFTSCEFAVRPFLINYPDRMMQIMQSWASHENHAVRRFASEGCRPRLPWAMAIPFLKINPEPILPILEKLKNDSSEFVRKSVANNLNDISKDHPQLVIDLVQKWKGKSMDTDWVCKHGSRTLLKQGNREVLDFFGLNNTNFVQIKDFQLLKSKVQIGDNLKFEFKLQNTNSEYLTIRLEYAIYYQKANGSLAKKVYKISEKTYSGNSETFVRRKQSFKIITTRKFHKGLHQVSVIVNGKEGQSLDFELQ